MTENSGAPKSPAKISRCRVSQTGGWRSGKTRAGNFEGIPRSENRKIPRPPRLGQRRVRRLRRRGGRQAAGVYEYRTLRSVRGGHRRRYRSGGARSRARRRAGIAVPPLFGGEESRIFIGVQTLGKFGLFMRNGKRRVFPRKGRRDKGRGELRRSARQMDFGEGQNPLSR